MVGNLPDEPVSALARGGGWAETGSAIESDSCTALYCAAALDSAAQGPAGGTQNLFTVLHASP